MSEPPGCQPSVPSSTRPPSPLSPLTASFMYCILSIFHFISCHPLLSKTIKTFFEHHLEQGKPRRVEIKKKYSLGHSLIIDGLVLAPNVKFWQLEQQNSFMFHILSLTLSYRFISSF